MYLSILILPFLGSIISGFLGRKVGITGSQIISCGCLFLSALLSSFALYEVGFCDSPVIIQLGNWIDSEIMIVSWEFLFDQVAVVFCIMITYITFLILVYTIYYMDGSPHIQRFFSYLSAFAGFMLVLVTGGNYFVMFCGWEGIGIISYLLISYYFTRIQATKAALLALTMNRGGDMLLSIGFFALFAIYGSLDYSTIFSISPYINENAITIISLLLFGGAMAKSAQLPLHTWLPGSMEARHIYIFLILIYLLIFIFDAINIEGFSNVLLALETKFSIIFPTVPLFNKVRDSKGRFITPKDEKKKITFNWITKRQRREVMNPLIGNLLGYDSLRFTHKGLDGKSKFNSNALYTITLKDKDYIYYLPPAFGDGEKKHIL